MSDTILGGDFTVYYGAENRQKRIVWTGSATGTRTVNELYSALQDLFDELTQMDDGVPMSAQTPTEYTIGIIDAGDKDPWFIDRTSVEHLTAGALKTASWTRSLPGDGSGNVGILRISCNNTNIVAGDIGQDITHTNGDAGTLLDVKGTGADSILWVRPDSNALANDFDDSSGTLTCNTHTATQSAAGVTGESLWSNIYTLGTIEANTHIYIYQNAANLVAYKDTSDWWSDGHIDILVNVKEIDLESDEGYITVYARQYSKTYSYYIVDLTAGGRNPIPLQTGKDLDNQTGYRTFTGSSGSGTFDVGNYIYVGASWAAATKKGVITAATTGSSPVISYYLIGDPITDFAASDSVKEYTGTADGDATCTAGSPSDAGPAALGTPPTATFGGLATGGSNDIDENGTPENYSITIDCNQNALTDVYEWSKYITRRGNTGDIDAGAQTIVGESHTGSDYRIIYETLTGSISDGATVTQVTSAAKGTVVNHNTTDKILILRNSRGTFNQTNNIQVDGSNYVTITGATPCVPVTPIAAAPFGTFAGGKFFCAPGVVLTDYLAADANNFQLVDDNGTVRVAPTKVNVTVNNTRAGDKVAVFRLTSSGGDINKATYNATVQSAGATTAVVGSTIGTDEPGKTTGGVIRLVDTSANTEYRLRFASWSSSTFTLASLTGLTADASGCDADTLTDTGQSFLTTVKVGDLIRNTTEGVVAYVTAVVSDTELTTTPVTDWTSDTYEINTLPVATTTSPQDTYYVPFIDVYETTGTDGSPGSETVQIVFSSTVYTRVRARNAGNILPFEQDSSITGTGMTVSVIRSADTIFT